MDEISKAQFWSKVSISSGNSKKVCWRWQSSVISKEQPYGRFQGKLAHRISYEICKGAIPKGLEIRHLCHNPNCVNPHHLDVGTHQENMNDMNNSGRGVYVKGSQHGNSKLVESQVLEIRDLWKTGMKRSELAEKFNVSPHTISKIVKREYWKHIP